MSHSERLSPRGQPLVLIVSNFVADCPMAVHEVAIDDMAGPEGSWNQMVTLL